MNTNWLNEDHEEETKTTAAVMEITPRFDELTVFGQSEDMAAATVESLLERYNGVESYVIAKKWVEMMEIVETALKPIAVNATNEKRVEVSFGGKTVAVVTERNLPRKYTYQDAKLLDLEEQKAKLDIVIKERKKMLEAIKSEVADPETGELIQPALLCEQGMTIAVKYL